MLRASWKEDLQDSYARIPASGHFRALPLFHSSFAPAVSLDLSHCNARKSLSVQFVTKMSIDGIGKRKEKKEKNHVWHKTLAPSFSPLLWLNKSEILWLKKKRYEFKKLDSSSSNSQNENKASAKCTKNFIRPATEWCVNFQVIIRQALYGSAICNIPSCMFSKNDKAPKCVHDIQAGLNVACYHIATEVFYRKTQRCWACKLIQAADLREREYCLTQCTSADVKLAVQSRKWPANKL